MGDSLDRPEETTAAGEKDQTAGATDDSAANRTEAEGSNGVAASGRVSDDTVSLLDLLLVIARRWRLIFFTSFFAAVGIVLFSIYTLRMPPDSPYNPMPNVYRPEAQILLRDPESSPSGLSGLSTGDLGILAGLASVGGGQGESSAALAQRLLTGNNLVDRIVEEFGLLEVYQGAEAPLATARKAVRGATLSEFDADSGVLTVSFEDIDPVFATDVLQSVVGLLESRFTFLTRDSARAQTDAIERQLQQLEDDLTQAREAFAAFQRRYGVVNPAVQGQQTMSLIAGYKEQIIKLEIQRETLLQLVEDQEDPQVRRIEREIELLENLVQELETGFRVYSPITIPRDQIGPLTIQYEDLQRDLVLKESIYTTFQAELVRAQLESQDTTRRFQVIEPPEVPQVKAGPSRGTISVIVTVTAFFLSVFAAFIVEYFSRAKDDPNEARKIESIKDQFRLRRQRAR